MTTTYEDFKDLHEAGNSAAEIATTLVASPLHNNDIVAASFDPEEADLFGVLEHHDLLDGSLEAAVLAQSNDAITAAWEKLKRHLTVVNRPVRCGTKKDVAEFTTTLTQLAMVAKPEMAGSIQSDMDELTGGVKYADVTEAEVQALIDAEVQRQQEEADAEYLQTVFNKAARAAELLLERDDLLAMTGGQLEEQLLQAWRDAPYVVGVENR